MTKFDTDLNLNVYKDAIRWLKRRDYTVVWLSEYDKPAFRPKPFTSTSKLNYLGRIKPKSKMYKQLIETLNIKEKIDCQRVREDIKQMLMD